MTEVDRAMEKPELCALDAESEDAWREFAEASPEATFFHLPEWSKILEQVLGHRSYYYYVRQGGRITGILPLAHIRSRLFGSALISTPFCVYGGICAVTAEARECLHRTAAALGDELGVDHLEYRSISGPSPAGAVTKDLYVTFRKTLDPDPEENLKAIPRKQRAMVRKGIQAGLKGEIDDRTDRFYASYSESLRNLGTPVLQAGFYRALKEVFGDRCEVLTITRDATVICSVMSFYFRDEVLPYYGGGGDLARIFKGNDFMYWELMRRATERGIRVFDYGRSKKGTGSYSFKKNWGFEPQPLNYHYHLVRARSVPDINPLNPKYRLFIRAWQHLPLPVSRWLGPLIARSLG